MRLTTYRSMISTVLSQELPAATREDVLFVANRNVLGDSSEKYKGAASGL
jgi:hypothetical protein